MGSDHGEGVPVSVSGADRGVKSVDSFGAGLKEVRNFLATLPPQGISIHGVRLDRAESIQQVGFLSDNKKLVARGGRVEKGTFVYHLKPVPTDANIHIVLGSVAQAITEARGWGAVKDKLSEAKVGLVVMVPPEVPIAIPYMHDGPTEGVAYPGHLQYPPGKEWVLGVVAIEPDPRENYIDREGELARKRVLVNAMKGISEVVRSNQDRITQLVENPPQRTDVLPNRQTGMRRFFGHLTNLLSRRRNLVDMGGLDVIHETKRVLNSDNPDPRNMVSLIRRLSGRSELYDQSVGVWEGYTLGQHTQMVVTQFERYFSADFNSPLVTKYGFRLAALLHDIGKPVNKYRQHEETLEIMPGILRKMGVGEKEIKILSAIVDQDYLGDYLGSGQDAQVVGEMIQTRASQLSKEIGQVVEPREYFQLIKILYMCDAGSYTVDAGGKKSLDHLFSFNRKPKENRGTMAFSPSNQERMLNLEQQVILASSKFHSVS